MADETYIDLNLKARPVEVEVAISDKSVRQAEGALSRLKKMADDMSSSSPMERMVAQAQRLADVTKGDTRRYEQAQQQVAAITARVAEAATRAHQQEQSAIESKVKALEREAAIKGKTGSARIEVQRSQFLSDGKFSPEQIARINSGFDQMAKSAAEAEKGAGGFINSFLKMTGAVSLGNLVADTFMRMAGAVKEFFTSSGLYAARTEQLKFAQDAVARSNRVSIAAVEQQARAVERLGVTIQDARMGVSRMIAVNMDYTKSAQLARTAQDLGRVAGISTAEAFERLVHATVTAQPELLRALGLNVSFEQSYARFAQSIGTTADKLTTQQKAQVALNAVLQAGAGYMGTYEASQESAMGQLMSMPRYFANIKQAIGEQFLPAMTGVIMKTVEWAKEMPKTIEKVADFGRGLSAAWEMLSRMSQTNWAIGVDYNVKTLVNGKPTNSGYDMTRVLMGAVTGTMSSAVRGGGVDDFDLAQMEEQFRKNQTSRLDRMRADTGEGQRAGATALGVIKSEANTLFGITERLTVAQSSMRKAWEELEKANQDFTAKGQSSASFDDVVKAKTEFYRQRGEVAKLEAQKTALDRAKNRPAQVREVELSTARELAAARGLESGAIAEIVVKAAARLEQLREEQKLSSQIIANVRETAALQVVDAAQKLAKKDRSDILDDSVESFRVRGRFASDYYKETVRLDQEFQKERDQSEERGLTRSRDIALRSLQLVHSNSVAAKIALEEQKYQVEAEYARKSEALQMAKIWREYAEMRRAAFQEFERTQNSGALSDRLTSIVAIRQQREGAIKDTSVDAIEKARTDASVRQSEIITDAWQRQFDSLKRGFEGLFDAALAGGKNFADSLKRIMLNALLTPVKEAFSNFAAKMFLPMFGGRVNSGGMSGVAGAVSAVGALGQVAGIPGYFPAPSGSSSTGGSAGRLGKLGNSFGGYGALFGGSGAGLLGGLSAAKVGGMSAAGLGGIGLGGALAGLFGAYKAGGSQNSALKYSAPAIGALSGAVGAGALTMMFPALAAAGPAGWIVGAGIGAAIGLIGIFRKGAEQKIIDKVRDRYQVKIDKTFAKYLSEQGKQYGDMDRYLGTDKARQEIWDYALSTNQKKQASVIDNQARGVFLEQRGGSLMQGAVYSGGTAYGYQSSLPSIGTLKPMTPAATSGGDTIVLDENGTKQFLTNLFVGGIVSNPTAVANANNAATAQNVGRLTAAGQLVDPLGGRL